MDKQIVLSYAQNLTILLQRLPPLGEHPDYAAGLNDLALLYNDMGEYEKALPLFQQVLTIRKKTVGEEHPDYARSLTNLANLYTDAGDFEKALPLYQQV